MGFAYGEEESIQMSMEVDGLGDVFFSHATMHKASTTAVKNNFVRMVFCLI